MEPIRNRLFQVRQRIADAARAAGRDLDSVQLLAVSKTRPLADLQAALEAGQRAFGESYLQDAEAKIAAIGTLAEWHFIGPLQSNKTRAVAEQFDWVHSIDRLKIAQRLSDQRPGDRAPLNVCLQVNISNQPSKSGITTGEAAELAQAVRELPGLCLRGLMALPAQEVDPRRQREAFRQLHQLSQALQQAGLPLDTLSMGMSQDLEAAIAEGTTLVRVGTAIFGARRVR